ncbi:MAG: nucleotidyltransferase domain-containing protein [Symploca sp. SIO1B1]|nr:nucleotidyltransferase domain-containing protein [Symploca sp. SIO1C2]NER51381.1 nucleotidyltransferase domain-containing protein [Symploca sp. SIO1A3]NER97072.1 nucleotidyltransferase domain-containing protein [Symploca sp. SIO1B1]
MTDSNIRQQLHQYIEDLPPESLPIAAEILAILAQQSPSLLANNLQKYQNLDDNQTDLVETKHYWKNFKNKLQLPSNCLQHEHLEEILTKFKKYLHRLYGRQLSKLVLFGSQARGDAKPESDIDVLLVLQSASDSAQDSEINALIADLCLEYNVLVSCVSVTEEQYYQENSPLLINIHREGIIL